MRKIDEVRYSYFPVVTVTKPSKSVSPREVHEIVTTDPKLKADSEAARKDKKLKLKLPGIMGCGTVPVRAKSAPIDYFGLGLDIDHCPVSFKARLAEDTFLNPVLTWESVSRTGLKLLIFIPDAVAENHLLYFEAASRYLKGAYGIIVDPATKDRNRIQFLATDETAILNENGFVLSDSLLRLIPKEEPKQSYVGRDAIDRVSAVNNNRTDETDEICTRLNNNPLVIERAFTALRNAGWTRIQGTDYWDRPGGRPGRISAVFNRFEEEDRWVFTNWSSNGLPFKTKGYSPLGVICELEFNGDFEACVTSLSAQYLDPGRTAFVK